MIARSNFPLGFRTLLILLLAMLLAIPAGCSSAYGTAKGKKGMVPCPCEKNNKRR